MHKELHELIYSTLSDKGPLGVNDLAKFVEVPVSTLQKRLHGQSYFMLNEDKKWDLPQNVAESQANTSIEGFDTLIDAQLTGIRGMFDMLTTQMKSTITLMSAHKPVSPPVAAKPTQTPSINQIFIDLDNKLKETEKVFVQYVSKAPEEYRNLIKNLDIYLMTTELGSKYLRENFNHEITSLFMNMTTELSESTVEILTTYQKGAK